MRKMLFIAALLLLPYADSWAQLGPEVTWSRVYGGNDGESAVSVVRKADSSYVVFGYTGSEDGDVPFNHGAIDLWMLWISKEGHITRNKCYGGSSQEWAVNMLPVRAGGYVLLGNTGSEDGDVVGYHQDTGIYRSDIWVVRLDDTGSILWQRCLGGTGVEYPYGIDTTADGGFIVCGTTVSEDGNVDCSESPAGGRTWLIKLDAAGTIEWQYCLLGGTAYAARTCPDGGYIVAGAISGGDTLGCGYHGNTDAWLMKLDAGGNRLWYQCYGGSNVDGFEAVQPLADGSYIALGGTYSNDGDVGCYETYPYANTWALAISSGGAILWQRCLLGGGIIGINMDADSNILLLGLAFANGRDVTNFHGGSGDAWIVKLRRSDGQLLWQRCYGGNNTDYINAVHPAPEGGYYAVGSSLSSPGTGDMYTSWENGDIWLGRLSATPAAVAEPGSNAAVSVYPTLTQGIVHILLPEGIGPLAAALYSSLGQQVPLALTGNGTTRQLHMMEGLPPGIYLLRITGRQGTTAYKIEYRP